MCSNQRVWYKVTETAVEWKVWQYVLPVLTILFCLIIGIIVKRTVIKRLAALADKTRMKLDNIVVRSLMSVVVLWFILIGLYISIYFIPLSLRESDLLEKVFQTLLILSIFGFLMRLVGGIFFTYSEKLKQKIPAASIFKNAVKIFILTIGILIVLQTLGISITPLITTLGVGGLAVALALQDTLANLFAGFHIIATKRVKTGDYIKLDSGQEGYVVDVTWRDTVIRQLHNNYVIIPNSRISSAILINFYKPRKAINVLVEIGVDYSSDLEKVEQITLDVARKTLREVPGGVSDFEAFMRYHTFGESSINFTVYLRCQEFFDKFYVQHEFIKRLKKRYDQEGIVIPFPIRTVVLKQEK